MAGHGLHSESAVQREHRAALSPKRTDATRCMKVFSLVSPIYVRSAINVPGSMSLRSSASGLSARPNDPSGNSLTDCPVWIVIVPRKNCDGQSIVG